MSNRAGLKSVNVSGNLTGDPELRFTPSGQPVASFTVAVNERHFDKQANDWVDSEPAFIRVSAWRRLAENVSESLHKGDRVMVTGSFAPNTYTNKEGQQVTTWEMTATEVGASLSFATTTIARTPREEFAGAGAGASRNGDAPPPF